MAVTQPEVADKELIDRAEQGDRDAFATLYERYFQGLYDFALRIVRDRDLAADVVQSAFVKAWDAAREQKGVENVKAWLYTITHNLAIDELRLRKRIVEPRGDGEEEHSLLAVVDPSRLSDPEAVVGDRELVDLVWDSAAALSPQEYALLDLHLRRGFDSDELAEHLGLAKGAVYTRLSRLRDSLEEAVTTTLLLRRGGRECAELDAMLNRLRVTEATQSVRRAIKEHMRDCEICQESKRRFVSPAEIFAGISLVPVSLELMEEVWSRIGGEIGVAAAAGAGAAGAAHAAPGDPGVAGTSVTTAKGVAASALVTGAAIVVATALVFRGDGAVEDPADVHSTTHAVGRASSDNVIRMAWSEHGGADAYSISWAKNRALPDETADLDGGASSTTSPPLAAGSWYFNLRTRGDGEWTSTVHVGPFVIVRRKESVRAPAPPRPKRVLHVETGEGSAASSSDLPTATAVAGVAVTRPGPQESYAGTPEKAAPRRPAPPYHREPVTGAAPRPAPVEPPAPEPPPPPPAPELPLPPSPPPSPAPTPSPPPPAPAPPTRDDTPREVPPPPPSPGDEEDEDDEDDDEEDEQKRKKKDKEEDDGRRDGERREETGPRSRS